MSCRGRHSISAWSSRNAGTWATRDCRSRATPQRNGWASPKPSPAPLARAGSPDGSLRADRRSQIRNELEHLGRRVTERSTEAGQAGGDPTAELDQLFVVDGFHRALELAGVRLERVELAGEVGAV